MVCSGLGLSHVDEFLKSFNMVELNIIEDVVLCKNRIHQY